MYVLGEGKPAARAADRKQELKEAKDELAALAEGGKIWSTLLGGEKEEKHNV